MSDAFLENSSKQYKAELESYFEEISAAHDSVHSNHHGSTKGMLAELDNLDNLGKIISDISLDKLNPRDLGRLGRDSTAIR